MMPTPKNIVNKWVAAFNKADVATLSALYHDDAINHQAPLTPIEGKAAIAEMFIREFAAANMVCQVRNLFEDGDHAILEWTDPHGLMGCGFFHIVDGKIKHQRGYWDMLSFQKTQEG